jgi:pimeloyl-ACP methyl ester carboxylesterase
MPKASINGRRVHYQQMGQGRDLVLIHGLFSNLAFWYLTVMRALARDFRVTAYDLRGHGFTDMPQDGYTTYDLALDLRDLLDWLGVHHAHIAGHSFGSAIALHHAVLHPERVRSLILADARIHSLQPALPRRRAPYWKSLKWRLRRAGLVVPKICRAWLTVSSKNSQLKQSDSTPGACRHLIGTATLGW